MKCNTWRAMLEREMEARDDSTPSYKLAFLARPSERFKDAIACFDPEDLGQLPEVLPDGDFSSLWLDLKFNGAGAWQEGFVDFTIWSHYRVYFPVQYDSSWRVGSVPRNPCEEVANYFGGGS